VTDDLRRGRLLQRLTIAWNLAEVFVTIGLGIAARSLALVAFGLDSLVEVFASLVVLWHLAGTVGNEQRDRRARRLVALSFVLLAAYLAIAGVRALVVGSQPESSPIGIAYLAVTALVMFTLASMKQRLGRRLDSQPFMAEARMTLLDGVLASTIVLALGLNTALGWWWADAVAALIISTVAVREAVKLGGSVAAGSAHEL
jgi:divalent metal cation (Fe/Co/Zn/Cd) transporter